MPSQSKGQGQMPAKRHMGRTSLRVLKMLLGFYPVLLPAVIVCIIANGIVQTIPNVFMERVLTIVQDSWTTGDWDSVAASVLENVAMLVVFYLIGIAVSVFWTQTMAYITQGSLKKFRCAMFNHMQDLPIRYFDTHQHGDVMSYYTNDIDAMRMMISQSLPQLLLTSLIMISVTIIMFYYSAPMALVVIAGALLMAAATRFLGGRSMKSSAPASLAASMHSASVASSLP